MLMQPQLSVRVRPNNQITITSGNYRETKKVVATSAYMEQSRLGYISRELIEVQKADSHIRKAIAKHQKNEKKKALDIIKKSQRSKPAPFSRINKPKSFTKVSGQKLRESGAAMSMACSGEHARCREVTLTLPAGTQEAFTALAAYSGYVVNRLFQPIRREWGNKALWFFVWEYQKRGALHMHIALYNESIIECERMATKLIEQWKEVLIDVGRKANCCMFTSKKEDRCTVPWLHQNHTAPIEKDIACYFSKYAGKEESKNSWYCKKYPVSRFWGSSKQIKRIIKNNSAEWKCDSFSSIHLANENMTNIITNLLDKIDIVSINSYEFDIKLNGSHSINRYKNGRKIINTFNERTIASGTRYTIYFNQNDFEKVIEFTRNLSEYF